ncbi:M14 family zinc carboxypeptidase [Aquipuribacter sp. SD81]|uniref:M14 family zinc carboxypeptidase n=1 Tax=Aquipuribacter sp. SD81 TaxID=3127703 RepID=UPI00301B4519
MSAPTPRAARAAKAAVAVPAVAALTLATLAVTATTSAAAPPNNAACGTQTGDTSVAGFLSHEEVGDRLDRIERTSKGVVDVDVAGYTNQGREIWTARVGTGDTVVLVESQIHGNEPHGTVALLNLLATLGNGSQRSAEIREAVTVVAIPQLNGDGAALDQRQSDITWDEVVETYPQLAGAPVAWNYSNRAGGFDLNRDFNPDLDYVPSPADLPGTSAGTGWYLTPEARTVRDVYAGLEDEFGTVDVFVDLHNQGPCYSGEDMDVQSTLSISGRFIADPTEFGDWPEFDYDASRQVNVAVYDALQERGQSGFAPVTLYPQDTNLPGTALGSFALRGSATVLFETTGQTQSTGQKELGMLVKQVEVGLTGILDAITDGTLDDIDPERYEDIPERTFLPRD